jgi:gamma-glutamyl-gamma-aminobutyrate hydrolase PuuD
MVHEIESAMNRHEQAIEILGRIKFNAQRIQSIKKHIAFMDHMFGHDPSRDKHARSLRMKRMMGSLLADNYQSICNSLHA